MKNIMLWEVLFWGKNHWQRKHLQKKIENAGIGTKESHVCYNVIKKSNERTCQWEIQDTKKSLATNTKQELAKKRQKKLHDALNFRLIITKEA